MSKKGIIKFLLVKECSKKKNEEILKDIIDAFSKEDIIIPWCNYIEKVVLN